MYGCVLRVQESNFLWASFVHKNEIFCLNYTASVLHFESLYQVKTFQKFYTKLKFKIVYKI